MPGAPGAQQAARDLAARRNPAARSSCTLASSAAVAIGGEVLVHTGELGRGCLPLRRDRQGVHWRAMATELDESDHCKEVYAHAGLALYFAQVLEHSVVNAMLFARMPEYDKVTRAEIDAFLAQQFEKPLGAMLKVMRHYVTVPADVDGLLSEALSKRNWLAHEFFREFAEPFMNAKGRDEMLAWLEDAESVFQRATKALDALTNHIREKYGITNEAVAKVVAEVQTDLK
jgi:hypothetical protein